MVINFSKLIQIALKQDALKLTKKRLANGGFDRIARATLDDISTNKAPQYSKFLFTKLLNPKIRKDLLEKEPIIDSVKNVSKKLNQKILPDDGGAGSNFLNRDGGYYFILNDGPWAKVSLKNNNGVAHEYVHYVYAPSSYAPGFNYNKGNEYDTYFRNAGGLSGEVAARGTQLKNYFGLEEGQPLTEDMLEYAKHHYIKDTGLNNGMSDFFSRIINPKEFLPWINKHAPVIIGGYATQN